LCVAEDGVDKAFTDNATEYAVSVEQLCTQALS